MLAFVTNRSFIESRTFDGFRKTVAQEFADIYVVDLGGDVRANPKLSGTKHNVFGIQTGVAISFMIKKVGATKDKKPARVYYVRRPEMETAEEKLGFLANHPIRTLDFDEVSPDKNANWVNLTNNDFDTLIPLASKETKASKTAGKERAIFKLFSLGVVTNRDEWVYDDDKQVLKEKVSFLIDAYNNDLTKLSGSLAKSDLVDLLDYSIKWTRSVKSQLRRGMRLELNLENIRNSLYRPFTSKCLYFDKGLNEFQYQTPQMWPNPDSRNRSICFTTGGRLEFCAFATDLVPGLTVLSLDANQCLALEVFDCNGNRHDNITDWALKQFTAHYQAAEHSPQPSPDEKGNQTGASKPKKITKEAIFHYCYAVLHDPVYRDKYAQNLKREFPRIPFYPDFWLWAAWGEALMAIHIGYESVEPFPLSRTDVPDEKVRAAGLLPKALLRADPASGSIALDTETTLRGIPSEAWAYKLGNRCAIDWVLHQYKEKKPKDPTIREKFDTYRFADYKDKVIDLLMRVTTVSVQTVRVTEAMKAVAR